MRTLLALIAIALACARARPSAYQQDVKPPLIEPIQNDLPMFQAPRQFYTKYILPQVLLANYYAYDDPRIQSNLNTFDREINMISRMNPNVRQPYMYGAGIPYWAPSLSQLPLLQQMDSHSLNFYDINQDNTKTEANSNDKVEDKRIININVKKLAESVTVVNDPLQKKNDKKDEKIKNTFALTPLDAGYFDPKGKDDHKEEVKSTETPLIGPRALRHYAPRQTRQNPNLGKTKSLVAEDLERLRIGLSVEDMDGTDKPHHIHVFDTPPADPEESLFGVALLAAVGAAVTMAVIAFAIGWWTLSKKAKAAADVDYPAYGVTGPSADSSGDRKLAQSAHMFHYQHQKQQIIAMERTGLELRNGSISDPESEDENEEGDYTVYECPGFATTGDMEVKNPLFKDEPTPATPGKVEEDKPVPTNTNE